MAERKLPAGALSSGFPTLVVEQIEGAADSTLRKIPMGVRHDGLLAVVVGARALYVFAAADATADNGAAVVQPDDSRGAGRWLRILTW